MRIRELHPIRDRLKLILLLFMLLVVFGNLARIVREYKQTPKTATIEGLLNTALEPIGSTMYIWGGGWNGEDSAAGATSTEIGVSPQWENFAQMQDASYNFEDHRYERENGLDCSGYVGWVLYNTFEKESGLEGYVTLSTDIAKSMAQRGWGKLISNPRKFFPGDIVSMEGHVWICLGTCADGSVLLAHSSPPGVSICGTLQTDGLQESIAVKLATEYMTTCHPEWQEKYSNRSVSDAYLQNIEVFRWSKMVMLDAEEMQNKSAEEIIGILSPDM